MPYCPLFNLLTQFLLDQRWPNFFKVFASFNIQAVSKTIGLVWDNVRVGQIHYWAFHMGWSLLLFEQDCHSLFTMTDWAISLHLQWLKVVSTYEGKNLRAVPQFWVWDNGMGTKFEITQFEIIFELIYEINVDFGLCYPLFYKFVNLIFVIVPGIITNGIDNKLKYLKKLGGYNSTR